MKITSARITRLGGFVASTHSCYYSDMNASRSPPDPDTDFSLTLGPPSTTPPPKMRRRSLLLLVIFRLLRSAASAMIAVALPYLVLRKLHYGSLMLGAIYMIGLASTAVLGLAVGHLADRWSRKGTLILTGVMVPLSALLVYARPDLPILFLASLIGGFAATGSLIGGGVGGAAQPAQTAVIADLTTLSNRTLYYSVLAFLSGVAGAGGAWLVRYFSIHNVFLVAAGLSALGLPALVFMVIPARPPAVPRTSDAHKASRKNIRKFGITGMFNGFSQGLITPFLIPFFVIVYGLHKSQMASYTSVATMLGAVSLLAAPMLEKRLGFVRSIAFTRALGTLLLLVMAIWHNLDFALIIYAVTPALRIAALPAQQTAITSRVHSDDVGRALAVNQVARVSAASGAILCTGYLFDLSAVEVPFFIYAAVMSANIFLYFKFFPNQAPSPIISADTSEQPSLPPPGN
ncbi:MAG: MFS transporter [Phycisphaerae bacterium]|nr:MFS transporter [Phycisphaerae bacterium]